MWKQAIKRFSLFLGNDLGQKSHSSLPNAVPVSQGPNQQHNITPPLPHNLEDSKSLRGLAPWPQTCFMHIGKTGGTALHHFFLQNFGKSVTFFGTPEQFDSLSPSFLHDFFFVAGHFSYNHVAKFNKHRILISFVREPVDRVVSAYWFLRTWQGEINDQNRAMVEAAQKYDLLDFLELDDPQVHSITNNHQAYFFASDWRSPRKENDNWLTQTALLHFNLFNFIGVTDRMEESLQVMSHLFYWPHPNHLPQINGNPNRKSVKELSTKERTKILELNQGDALIYKAACRKLSDQSKVVNYKKEKPS